MRALYAFFCLGLLQDLLFWLGGGNARIARAVQETKDEYCAAAGRVLVAEQREAQERAEEAAMVSFARGEITGRQQMHDYLLAQCGYDRQPTAEEFSLAERGMLH